MEMNEIVLSFLKNHPIVSGFIGLLIYSYLFGDRKQWEYEAKFPLQEEIGRGEVELECLKKKGTQIEIEFTLTPAYQNKSIEIFRNSLLLYTIDAEHNNKTRLFIKDQCDFEKPKEGDEINVRIDGKSIFTAPLILD